MSKKKRFFFWAALWFYVSLVVNPFHLQIPTLIYMNTTASLPVGIYFAIPGFGVRDGDIVAYEQDEKVMEVIRRNGWIPNGGHPAFIKYAAIEGGHYEVDSESLLFRVNGKLIGNAMTSDGKGHTMIPRCGSFEITQGFFLPYTSASRSYDGRYTGTVSTQRIYSRVIPLLTK